MNDREITSSRTRLRRRGTGDRAVARLPGQPTPVRPACARACPTTSGDVRLPRLGKIRQARRLHVHRQQPDRRPRRRHHALAARLGGAGGPRRLRPPAIDWVLEHPERVSRLVLLNTDYWRMPGRLRPRRRSGCSPLRSSVGQPVRCRCGWVGWCFAACTGGRWGASSGRGVGAQFIPQLYEQFTVSPTAHEAFLGLIIEASPSMGQVSCSPPSPRSWRPPQPRPLGPQNLHRLPAPAAAVHHPDGPR
jgi:hypothetical protein